ncbi:MAG: carboxypeptidase-like regulatory domain-containing protein, partial [Candidatus Sericytochromatia bacterium]|nr:carboxypeptidase-like regulatory domain-containing protein [Candidatus Sericytochromatia bacterium]
MAFTRKNVAAAVAGTLSLAMLTGCPAPNAPSTGSSAAPSAAPSAATSAAPSAAASAAPSAAASGAPASDAPSAAPSVAVSAPPPSGKTVIVSGTVRNEKGATVDGATVTVKSLNPSITYSATAQTTDGSYVVNNVPEGVNVEVVVTKDGYTTRRRVQSFQQSATGQKNLLNFGAQTGAQGEDGGAYFISDYPEIAMTTPEHDAKGVDGTKLSFKVVLSEAIDEDSRDAFEKNF